MKHKIKIDRIEVCKVDKSILSDDAELGASAYEYIYDRVSKRFRLPSLAELIRAKRFLEKDYDTG